MEANKVQSLKNLLYDIQNEFFNLHRVINTHKEAHENMIRLLRELREEIENIEKRK